MGERARSLTAEQGDRGEAQLLAGHVLSCLWAAHPSLSPPGSTGSKREPGSGLRQQQQGSSSGCHDLCAPRGPSPSPDPTPRRGTFACPQRGHPRRGGGGPGQPAPHYLPVETLGAGRGHAWGRGPLAVGCGVAAGRREGRGRGVTWAAAAAGARRGCPSRRRRCRRRCCCRCCRCCCPRWPPGLGSRLRSRCRCRC